jgi:hypothetical protein
VSVKPTDLEVVTFDDFVRARLSARLIAVPPEPSLA